MNGAVFYGVALNGLGFLLMGIDKGLAQRGKWRISERWLMIVALLGGAQGVLMAMVLFHHKLSKPKFFIFVPVLVLVDLFFIIWLCFFSKETGI